MIQKVVVTFEVESDNWVKAYLIVSRIFSTLWLPDSIKKMDIENGMEGAKK